MKNIHLIPTDKPSRLHNKNGELGNYPSTKLYIEDFKGNQHNSFHIYITSDEEIKQVDWFYDGDGELCKYTSDYVVNPNGWNDNKKIILTTDGDLIKDGVQKIDDEFIEWFVNNPRCEWVEVKKEMYMPFDGKVPFELSLDQSLNTRPHYKIITKDYLQGFIDLHNNELDHWDAVEFLEWLKLNDFKIVKK
jgi:hypothetical protein